MRNRFTTLMAAGLMAAAVGASAQAKYNLRLSDTQPRLNHRNSAYIWHEGSAFYVAVTGPQTYSLHIEADKGNIMGVERRTTSRDYAPNDLFSRYWANDTAVTIDHANANVLQYTASPPRGMYDVVRFTADQGATLKFVIKSDHGQQIYVGGDKNRHTNQDEVVIKT